MNDTLITQSKALSQQFRYYWKVYGGIRALTGSPFLWISFVIALPLSILWQWQWQDKAISVLPNLVGLSFAAYAVIVGFSPENFLQIIRGDSPNGRFSPYISGSVRIAHFVFIQIVSLIIALVWDGAQIKYPSLPIDSCTALLLAILHFIGAWIFIYAVVLGLPALLQVFLFSKIYNQMPKDDERLCKRCPILNSLEKEASVRTESENSKGS